MFKMFAAFQSYCEENNIPSEDMQITITAKKPEAAVRFEIAWERNIRSLSVNGSAGEVPAVRFIYGIPFEYKRAL